MSTVWPRWRSGAVGSKPALMRMGLPAAMDCWMRSLRASTGIISAAPLVMRSSWSSTDGNVDMVAFKYKETEEQRAAPRHNAGPKTQTRTLDTPEGQDLQRLRTGLRLD